MTVELRDARDDDVSWMADLGVGWDGVLGRDFWVRLLRGEVEPVLVRRVVVTPEGPAGFAILSAPPGLTRPLLAVVVAPALRGRGLGSALLADALAAAPPGEIGGNLPDDDPSSWAIVQHWGFEELGHGIDSVLVLTDRIAPAPLPAEFALEYVRGADVGAEVDALLGDVGDYPEGEVYGSRITNAGMVGMAPDLRYALVRDGSGLVALTAISPLSEEEWYVHFTGCAPRARGRGLARAAKEAAHALAEQRGAVRVRTTNEDRNAAMRALNASLGYVADRGDYRVVLRRGVAGT